MQLIAYAPGAFEVGQRDRRLQLDTLAVVLSGPGLVTGETTVRALGLEIRAGLHTGECEIMGDKLGGIAVHIGARVAALAQPGEVLVSSTVKDLVAGSGLTFQDRGTHLLKGVPDKWRLFAVRR